MSSPSLPDASLRASTLHLPAGPWSTVLEVKMIEASL
ncbi:hypothetical protein K3Z87_21860, partial [Pseudomonas aeruginosa]|nr:hypothetical protein [Pseudomonas aeruginosa]